jgi:hypothetical protein
MANTIRITTRIEYLDESTPSPPSVSSKTTSITTTSAIHAQVTQIVGTSHELITAGDQTDDVVCMVENKSASATLSLGVVVSATYYPLLDIPAGERAILPRLDALASTYIKSTAASTNALVTLYKVVAPA